MSLEETIKIANIGPQNSKINIEAIILNKDERLVNTKDGRQLRVCDCLIEDDSGQINLTLWEGDVDKVKAGDNIKITNGYITTFKNTRQIQLGKWGKLEVR